MDLRDSSIDRALTQLTGFSLPVHFSRAGFEGGLGLLGSNVRQTSLKMKILVKDTTLPLPVKTETVCVLLNEAVLHTLGKITGRIDDILDWGDYGLKRRLINFSRKLVTCRVALW